MKRIAAGLAACALVLALASQAAAQITGSAHDFRGTSWGPATPNGEICVVCHTPHNANTNFTPLWNHEAATGVSYTMYTGLDIQGTVDASPTGASQLCLSCHDGQVALDNYGGVTTGTTYMTGAALVGTDLSNDHPISITYTTSTAGTDGALYNPSTQTSGVGASPGTIAADMLESDKVQCSSCHDVHNAYGFNYLLVKSNAGSDLCLTCHIK